MIPKIDLIELSRLLADGKGTTEIAKIFICTPGAVSQAKKRLKQTNVRQLQLKEANTAVAESLSFVRQLRKINDDAHTILDTAMSELQGDKPAVVGVGAADPRAVAIKAMIRIEAQLKLQNETLAMLADMNQVLEFQNELIDLLNDIDPELKNEFMSRLRERSALQSVLRSAGPRSHQK